MKYITVFIHHRLNVYHWRKYNFYQRRYDVYFVDNSGIYEHHCLNFLSIDTFFGISAKWLINVWHMHAVSFFNQFWNPESSSSEDPPWFWGRWWGRFAFGFWTGKSKDCSPNTILPGCELCSGWSMSRFTSVQKRKQNH